MDMSSVADAIDINAIMRQATRGAEKQSGLAPVFLKRDSFAGSAVSTGSLCIDRILGGGVPSGRIVGISGPERAGKTLLATQIGANQVSKHHFLKYMDAEGSTDPIFLAARGIDFDKYRGKRNSAGELKPKEVDYVDFYQPSTVEQITNYIHTISGALPENRNPTHPVCMYMLDSVVALITDDIDSDVIDSNKMSMHARAYATYLPVINSDLVKSGSTLIYTNQLRQKPGVKYGSPLYEPCGDALKFFSSIRMMLSQTKPQLFDKDHPFLTKEVIPGVEVREGGVWEEPHVDKNGNIVGTDRYVYTGIKTVKNKIYTPYQKCWMRVQFEENGSTGHGLDPVFDIFTFLLDEGYIASGKNEKGKDVKGSYVARKCDQFDPIKELGMPASFDYFEFKRWVSENKGLTSIIRDKLLVSGIVFSKEDSVKIDYGIKKEAELEEQETEDAISELTSTIEQGHSVDDNLENVEKKKRGRKPKA